MKHHDTRKDELPQGVFLNQLAQSILFAQDCHSILLFFAHKQPAVSHDSKEGAGVLDELALLLIIQKTENCRARREQKHVHLIFARNARVVGFNKDLAVLAGLEFLAAFVSGNAAANIGVSSLRIVVLVVQPQKSLSPEWTISQRGTGVQVTMRRLKTGGAPPLEGDVGGGQDAFGFEHHNLVEIRLLPHGAGEILPSL
jgi:hypothetical protein